VPGEAGLKRFDELNTAGNEEIVWWDSRHRGFIRLEINLEKIHAELITVSNVELWEYKILPICAFDILCADGPLQYA